MILSQACFLVAVFTVCRSEDVPGKSQLEEDKKQLILYPPATKNSRQPSTMLVYGQQEGSGQDNEVDKEAVDTLSNNVLALSSLVKAQSEVIENLSREVAELREKLGSVKEQEAGTDKVEGKIKQMERGLQNNQMSIAKLDGDFSSVNEKTTKIQSVVKKMLKKLEDKCEEGDEELDSKLKSVESHLESLYELQRTTAEALGKEWPRGHYCILANGKCPSGFRRHEGHLKSLYLYSQHEQFLREAEFGNSYVGCFGKYCGEYGNFVGSLKIVSCCK